MNKLYLLHPGILEDTVIYELKPVEVSRLRGGETTIEDMKTELDRLNASTVLVDSSFPEVVDELIITGRQIRKGRD